MGVRTGPSFTKATSWVYISNFVALHKRPKTLPSLLGTHRPSNISLLFTSSAYQFTGWRVITGTLFHIIESQFL